MMRYIAHLCHGRQILVRSLVLFITGRNEVVAQVIFLHLIVILFTGVVVSVPHPGTRYTPHDQVHPPNTVYEGPVRILLECILIVFIFGFETLKSNSKLIKRWRAFFGQKREKCTKCREKVSWNQVTNERSAKWNWVANAYQARP